MQFLILTMLFSSFVYCCKPQEVWNYSFSKIIKNNNVYIAELISTEANFKRQSLSYKFKVKEVVKGEGKDFVTFEGDYKLENKLSESELHFSPYRANCVQLTTFEYFKKYLIIDSKMNPWRFQVFNEKNFSQIKEVINKQ